MRVPITALVIFTTACAARPAVCPPNLVTREQWGSKPRPIPDSRRQTPRWITIHHAGELWKKGQDPVEFVRQMQVWGQNRPKTEKPPRDIYWPDLPYHYLIAPDGRVFEGRPVEYEPESNTKYPLNGNIGIEMMGDFNEQRPSPAQLESVVQVTAWLMQKYRIPMRRVRTHKDVAPHQTDCPGMDLYRYIESGEFKRWIAQALDGRRPEIDPGPPLSGYFRHVINGSYDEWIRINAAPGQSRPPLGPGIKTGPTEPIPTN